MKVHKNPWATRPIVSYAGSLLHGLGIWLDLKLQKIATTRTTYIRDSFALKEYLATYDTLPAGCKLFTSDATAMYDNIDTTHAIREISRYIRRLPEFAHLPLNAIIAALGLIMHNNMFFFGDTHWLQRKGAAMGAPPATSVATIYYAIHEEYLIERFGHCFLFLKRYIDDMLCLLYTSDAADE